MQLITNPYHHSVIRKLAELKYQDDYQFLSLIERIRQMFPEYRELSVLPALVADLRQLTD